METKVERKENLEVVVTIRGEGEEWARYTRKEYNKQAKKVTVKGFRPGHVPADMIKARVNMGQVLNDALFNAVNDAFGKAVGEEKLQVYTRPNLNVSKISEKEFEATVTFAQAPSVTLGQYKQMGIKAKAVKVYEKDIKAYIDDLRNQHAVMQVKKARRRKATPSSSTSSAMSTIRRLKAATRRDTNWNWVPILSFRDLRTL